MIPAIYRNADSDDQLKKFLSLFGDEYNYLHSYAETYPGILDSRHCDIKFLPYTAQKLGVTLYAGLDDVAHRKLIDNAVYVYRWRGTKTAIEKHCEGLTGWKTTVAEGFKGVAVTNSPYAYTYSAALWNKAIADKGQQVGVTEFPRYWNKNDPQSLLKIDIYLETNGAERAYKESLLNSTLVNEVPVGVTWALHYIN